MGGGAETYSDFGTLAIQFDAQISSREGWLTSIKRSGN